MHYGVFQFSTDYGMRIDDLARAVEERGLESLFVPEHTHIPASRRSPFPGGTDLPREYWHTLDPFVALGAAAAVTRRIKLGTGICLVIERDPITLAKEVASLDLLSRGRVLFGIGGGWNAEEMENHGTDFASRWKLLRERVAAMKEIWTAEEPEYHGKFVNFDKIWSYPKPVQKPHPPILMGGSGPHARQRAVDFDGEWMPVVGRDPVEDAIVDLRRRAERAGRDPATAVVTLFGARPDEVKLTGWRDMGVARVLFHVPPAGRDRVLPLLDKYRDLATKIG
ncbi:MAG TPA: LLM class F420-dependent oxidoreductase [Candidatus Methylomirabilis sp.]|nr:LLM class F420-dependent oxidoreductase [Candidatus Methylomirabilis sp.]